MSSAEWNSDQAIGESALRRLEKERRELPQRFVALQKLVEEMWTDPEAWTGPTASSHIRSRIREQAAVLGVYLP